MKDKIWGLIAFLVAFNVAMMFVIARAVNIYLIRSLVVSLFVANIFIPFAFRRRFSGKTVSSSWALAMLGWTGWTVYIPVVGGVVCILIGVMELAWKPCVIGFVAITVGGWRMWAKGQVRRFFRDPH